MAHFKCRVCNHEDLPQKQLLKGTRVEEEVALYACDACGGWFTNPTVYMSQRAFHDEDLTWYFRREQKVRHKVKGMINKARALGFAKQGRFLDIGCGLGFSMMQAIEMGFEAEGFEPLEKAAEHAKDVLNLDVKCDFFRGEDFAPNQFDVVLLDQVLEHVYEPQVMMADIAKVLKPGGVLLLGVPNFDWLVLLITKLKLTSKINAFADPQEHINYYTIETIRHLCRVNNLKLSGYYYARNYIKVPFMALNLSPGYFIISK